MSGNEENTENRIVGPVSDDTTPQPRQPRNVQDLLRYSVEVQSNSERNESLEANSMDQGRRRFLEEALTSMVQDVMKELKDAMAVLSPLRESKEGEDSIDDEQKIASYEDTLSLISEFVDNIDIANDFMKMGGLDLMLVCISSRHQAVRLGAVDVIGLCTQNNPLCQKGALELGLLSKLMNMVEKDPNDKCRTKAFYALSCIIRGSHEALSQFIQRDGFSFLVRVLHSDNEALKVKCSFFISCLLSQNQKIKEPLVRMGFVEHLVGVIKGQLSRAHEHLLSALFSLVSDEPAAVENCRNPKLQLKACLQKHLRECHNDSAYMEVRDYIRKIEKVVFIGET